MKISPINNVIFKARKNKVTYNSSLENNALNSKTSEKVNKKPGLDNATKGEISVFDRIRNSTIYYHNAFLYRRDAYNWDKQIADAKELRKTASSALCDFKNFESEVKCNITEQAKRIRQEAKNASHSEFTYLNNDEKVIYEKNSNVPYFYKATYEDSRLKNCFTLFNWSDSCFDVQKIELENDLSRSIEYTFDNEKLTGIQAQCLKGILDSQDDDDIVVEKEFLVDESNLTVTYKRPEGLSFDTRYHFENNIVRRIDKASDAYARYISSYFYSKDGKLEEIQVQSYSETEGGKYPVQTVKSIKLN